MKKGPAVIGTTSPQVIFEVVSASSTTAINGLNNGGGVGIFGRSTSSNGIQGHSTSGNGVYGDSNSNNGIVGLTSAGGTTYYGGVFQSGSYYGSIGRADGYSFVGIGAVWATGSGSFNQSDGRLKENIQPLCRCWLAGGGKLFTIIYTWRVGAIRIVSMRRANKTEEKLYEKNV
jgi:hypothetical protein